MTTTITGYTMTSTVTEHYADRHPDALHNEAAWVVSWLPGRRFGHGEACTAMALAEVVALHRPELGDRWWPHVETWAVELDVRPEDAVLSVRGGVA